MSKLRVVLAAPQATDAPELRSGDAIEHPTFGAGRVVRVEDARLVLEFADGRERRFGAHDPRLRRVGVARRPEPPISALLGDPEACRARRAAREHASALDLRSSRASRYAHWGPCSRCEAYVDPLWRFRSSIGDVYVCTSCKHRFYDDARGDRDVLDLPGKLALRSAFESKG